MTRLFLRLWLGLLVALVLAVGATVFLVSDDMRPRANMERVLAGPMRLTRDLIRARIAEGATPEAAFATITHEFEAPLHLVRGDTLDLAPPQRGRLDNGDNITSARGDQVTQLIAIDSEHVLTLGPATVGRPDRTRPLVAITCLVAAVFVGLFLLVRPIERRLRRLALTADAFGAGRFDARAEVGGKDAIARLGQRFNDMAQRIERLVTQQHELMRVVSHELRTPLQRVRFALDMRLHENMERDLDELERLIDELLSHARLEHESQTPREPIDLRPSLDELVAELARGAAIAPTHDAAGALLARIDPRLFKRAVGNLVRNAQRHATSVVQVHARVADGLTIDVDDDGPGVPESERTKIGAGLGLTIVKRIAETHAGKVEVGASPLGGARFSLVLPLAAQSSDF